MKAISFKKNSAWACALILTLVVGITVLSSAFTAKTENKLAPTDTYYNSGNGVYTPAPPAPGNECAEPDPYPCSIELNTPIDAETHESFIYRGAENPQNTVPSEADGVKSESPTDAYNL